MYQFKANGGFGMMHQATKRLNESPFLQSNQIKPNQYNNLKIGVSWTEERMDGKVKCTGEITSLEPGSRLGNPPKVTLRDFSNGREVVTWLKGNAKYRQVAKEIKFTSGPYKGKAASIEKIYEMINS
ncbi:hypothetical protein phiA829_025 [Aeromonas phage phiA8-29]|uniref:Uncharacterized protein n=1 Tax=Aeromonas phage phiA8-29 TaxID=1978922 RepID=A0A1W6DY70_9CAUD|nr:hypothetical protein HWB15_gp026 [Aeromonas phage phiA8-29]ARK07845.1 hypothetical protein phiA829_025 [Aeromonas phage phiA8-29]